MIFDSGTSTSDGILASLNGPQRSAVERTEGPVLILAGAGSGKTRVLTHRIAHLIRNLGVRPGHILAFTFTNKAAGEMRGRVARLLGESSLSMWIGTFHATCVRILRASGKHRGIESTFIIYDTDDQERMMKEVLSRLNVGDREFRPRVVLSRISALKNQMLTPEESLKAARTYYEEAVARIYAEYQKELRRMGALDFDDLITETVWLLGENEAVRDHYASRFRYVHVDEYQDTNGSQYELIRHLSSAHRNLCVVGDDDQSIYGWRGADIGNILSFESTFPEAFVVRLEQNYRSTGTILAAANAVVRNNTQRKEKSLWTEREGGDPLRLAIVLDEEEEGELIVQRMTSAVHREGRDLKQLAVLYRTNAQSRAIENALRRAAIPYELVGGIPFYQRREVKDLLAYLRLAVNESDDVAFRRVFNVPKRGLGRTTLDRLAAAAFAAGLSHLARARRIGEEVDLGQGARERVSGFVRIIDGVKRMLDRPVADVLMALVEALDYGRYLTEDDPESAMDRSENVEELIVGARQFSERSPEPTVAAFLNEVALLTDADRIDEAAEKVRLMTAHNAKGLEFDQVFIAGLEEGLLPHASSIVEPRGVEEERRLFYVALTRARHQVHLSAAVDRRRFGAQGPQGLSRFLEELPRELIEMEESAAVGHRRRGYDRPARPADVTWGGRRSRPEAEGSWGGPRRSREASREPAGPRRILGKVIHPTFGRGEVVGQDGTGPEARLTVLFQGGVMRKIVARYAQWEESDVDF